MNKSYKVKMAILYLHDNPKMNEYSFACFYDVHFLGYARAWYSEKLEIWRYESDPNFTIQDDSIF
jgi:hypothetical protein